MPAAADTAQPSDTTPPSPAAAGKAGKRASGSKAPDAAAAVAPPEASVDATEATADVEDGQDAAAEPEPPEPEPGWFRNTAKTPLTVIPDQYPAAYLEPDEAAWLPNDPHHPNLERCEAPEPAPEPTAAADDTAGSEK